METTHKHVLRKQCAEIIKNMVLLRCITSTPGYCPAMRLMIGREHLRLYRKDFPDITDFDLRNLLPDAHKIGRMEAIAMDSSCCLINIRLGSHDTTYSAKDCKWTLDQIEDEGFFPESRSSQWCREDAERRTPKASGKPASFPHQKP